MRLVYQPYLVLLVTKLPTLCEGYCPKFVRTTHPVWRGRDVVGQGRTEPFVRVEIMNPFLRCTRANRADLCKRINPDVIICRVPEPVGRAKCVGYTRI